MKKRLLNIVICLLPIITSCRSTLEKRFDAIFASITSEWKFSLSWHGEDGYYFDQTKDDEKSITLVSLNLDEVYLNNKYLFNQERSKEFEDVIDGCYSLFNSDPKVTFVKDDDTRYILNPKMLDSTSSYRWFYVGKNSIDECENNSGIRNYDITLASNYIDKLLMYSLVDSEILFVLEYKGVSRL